MTPRERARKAAGHAQIEKKIKDLSPTFLDCRDPGLRHAWRLLNNFHVIEQVTEGRARVIFLGRDEACSRCDTVKQERFMVGRNGVEKTGQTYSYPEGYLMPGIPRGVKPSTIVYQEQYRRAMEKAAGAAAGQRSTSER